MEDFAKSFLLFRIFRWRRTQSLATIIVDNLAELNPTQNSSRLCVCAYVHTYVCIYTHTNMRARARVSRVSSICFEPNVRSLPSLQGNHLLA